MQTPMQFWDERYRGLRTRPDEPNDLAKELEKLLAPGSDILELGCGDGRDALHLAAAHNVTACDFSATALAGFSAAAAELSLTQRHLDLTALPYEFQDGVFDAVYARLSVHYFPRATVRDIFADIARLLRPGGFFLGLTNSAFDQENGSGRRIEERFHELSAGSRKRFFVTDEVGELLGPAFTDVDARYVAAEVRLRERWFVRIQARRRPE